MNSPDIVSFFMLLNSTLLPMTMYLVYKMFDISKLLGEIVQRNKNVDQKIDKIEARITSVEEMVASHEQRLTRMEYSLGDRYAKH